jgi:hypothetical protein
MIGMLHTTTQVASLNSLLAGKSTQEKLPTKILPLFNFKPFLHNQCVYVSKHNAQVQIQNSIRVTWWGIGGKTSLFQRVNNDYERSRRDFEAAFLAS